VSEKAGDLGHFGPIMLEKHQFITFLAGKMCRRILQVFNRSFDIDLLAVEPSFDFDGG
jgi:hypothetical protein